MLRLFISPRGRIGRQSFALATLCLLLFLAAQMLWFAKTGTNLANFFLSLALLFLNLHCVLCVFGKRLHDMGHSLWPLIGAMALEMIIVIIVMLKFGGLEYFSAFLQEAKIVDELIKNEQEMRRLHETYQASIADHMPIIRILFLLLPGIFILWLGLSPGQNSNNRYGARPKPIT